MILALYKDAKLVSLSVKECKDIEKYISIILPDDFEAGNAWSLKAFAWDDFSTMIPLAERFDRKFD